jgi:hypothetical protein
MMFSFHRAYRLIEDTHRLRVRAAHAEQGRAIQAAHRDYSGHADFYRKFSSALAAADQAKASGLAECEHQRQQERGLIDRFANLAPPDNRALESTHRRYHSANEDMTDEYCQAWRESHRPALRAKLGREPTADEIAAIYCPAMHIDVVAPQSVA